MEPARYSDPLEEAFSHGSQRVAQFASLAGAMGQMMLQRRALRDAAVASADAQAKRALQDQEDLLRHEARMGWTPAHDREWLAQADLLQTGRAWASATAFADSDASASAAQRKCEDRLRVLHPYAMARYDRLRADGLSALDAMRDAAPMFGREPHVRVGDPAPVRQALLNDAADREGLDVDDASGLDAPTPDQRAERLAQAERRGEQIAEQLQARARAAGRPALGPDELAMILETVTNLPEELITKISRRTADDPRAPSSAARIAAECFPLSAAEAVQASAVHRSARPAPQTSAAIHRSKSPTPPPLPI
ncbi:MAG TPA: hypothetical protein VFQ44_09515 [Streptosporangiaceae bacterium]|nr:hypothetical protein [Streptosporangiaceae bacterium]